MLFDRFGALSRMYIRDVVKAENCDVNGRFENVGYRLRERDFVEIYLDLTRETAMKPQEIPLNVVYEDDQILVVDKPAGMLSHPTHREKSGTLLNGLTHHLNRNRIKNTDQNPFGNGSRQQTPGSAEMFHSPPLFSFIRPGLVHRLDRETSGLMVIAATAGAHRKLAGQFQRKLVTKRYFALVSGTVSGEAGGISAPIGRIAEEKRWTVIGSGKYAETRWRVIGRFADSTLLELEPITGRTNQLRIHCAHIGHPIVGDESRGGRSFTRLCLHSGYLRFRHPASNDFMEFNSDSALPVFKSGLP